MTQNEINKRSAQGDDLQFRRHLIAMLRIVELRIGIPSSLRPEIGQRPTNKGGKQ